MHSEVIHKEAELLAWVRFGQFLEVLLELLCIDGVLVDMEQLIAFLFTDSMK